MSSVLIKNIVYPGDKAVSWVLFDEKTILGVGNGAAPTADKGVDGEGCLLLPGIIDTHVHFREPGLTHKGDIASESAAALASGVTSVLEMPNTIPPTTSIGAWAEKMDIASRDSRVNYAFFIGLTDRNLDEVLKADFRRIPGVKVFMGSSTGNMLVSNKDVLEDAYRRLRVPIVVHAEDEDIIKANREAVGRLYSDEIPVCEHSRIRSAEACYAATSRALDLLRRHPAAHLHVAHVTTSSEIELIREAKKDGQNVTCEVTPQHLLFTERDYDRLGTKIKINPSVKSEADREALRVGVEEGIVDIIATDHAPHTLIEKHGGASTAASGAPMVQFSLPLMLDMFGPVTVMKTMSENPARIFGIEGRGRLAPGYRSDMVLVETLDNPHIISDSDVVSKCGWTPAVDLGLSHRVKRTFLSGPEALVFTRK